MIIFIVSVSENSVLMVVVVTGAHVVVMGSKYRVLVVLWSPVRNRQCRGALECRSATAEGIASKPYGFASFCSGPHRPPPPPPAPVATSTAAPPTRHCHDSGRTTDPRPPPRGRHH